MTTELPSDLIQSKREHDPQVSDSSTSVNFRLDAPRETVGFKCNKKLWKAFVLYSRANYGSVCHVLEPILLALLTSHVNESKTIKPLHIETLNVERVVKRVRRVDVEVEESGERKIEVCGVCGRSAFVEGVFPSGSQFLCRADFEKVKSRLKGWRQLG